MMPTIVQIDIFKLAKFGSLKLRERNWFNDRQVRSAKAALQLAVIAQALALQYDIDPLEALNAVSNPQPGDVRLLPYASELGGVPDLLVEEMTSTGTAVTMFLESRLPVDFVSNNYQDLKQQYGIEIGPNDNWEQVHTDELPEAISEQIIEFMNNETMRWQLPTPEASEDNLGNESGGGEIPSTPIMPSTVPTVIGGSN